MLIVVLLGNSLIVLSVCKFPHMRRNSYILVANLSVSNTLIGLNFLFGATGRFIALTLEERKYLCLSKFGVFFAAFLGSEYNLLLISVERFIAILFPLWHKSVIKKTHIGFAVTACWIFYVTLAFLPLFGWNNYSDDVFCYLRSIWCIEYFSIIGCLVFVGFILNTVLFIVVLYRIKYKRIPGQTTQYKKTTWISFLILAGFVVCWGPFFFTTFFAAFWRKASASIPCSYEAMLFVGAVNGLVNWLIYGLCNVKFRETFKAILLCQNLSANS